jgi:hypothetical protein
MAECSAKPRDVDAWTRCTRRLFVPKPLNVRPEPRLRSALITTHVILERGSVASASRAGATAFESGVFGRRPCLKQEVKAWGDARANASRDEANRVARMDPRPKDDAKIGNCASLGFRLYRRSQRAQLAYLPKSGGRITEFSLVVTVRDYLTERAITWRAEEPRQHDRPAGACSSFRGEHRARPTWSSCRSTFDLPMVLPNTLLLSGQRLEPKLHGQGPRAEADAARPLPRNTREDANRDLQRPCRRDSSMLTRQLGCRASGGP